MIDNIRLFKEKKKILSNYFFDPDYYRKSHLTDKASDTECALNYLTKGWKLGYKPSKYFDIERFSLGKEEIQFKYNPLMKFVTNKGLPGFAFPSKEECLMLDKLEHLGIFDQEFYLEANEDVAENGMDPALHFIRHGWQERRSPMPGTFIQLDINEQKFTDFNSFIKYVSERKEDVILNQEFITLLKEESLFDESYYLKRYPDVAFSGLQPIEHFVHFGISEKRQPYASKELSREIRNFGDFEETKYLNLLRQHVKTVQGKVIPDAKVKMEAEGKVFAPIKQIDVLIVVKNYRLPSALWRAKFLCESLRLNGIKAVVRDQVEAAELIPSSSILFLQKFTNVDSAFTSLTTIARNNNCRVWGDLDDLFHPDYIHHCGQSLSGLWDNAQQQKIANGFMRVISRLDCLLVSTPFLKNVFDKEFPKLEVYLRRNHLPQRFLSRRTLPKKVNESFNIIYPSGSMSHKKDFEAVAEVMYEFVKRFKDCTLTLLGGDNVQVPKKLLDRPNVVTKPPMSFEDMMLEIEKHDLLIAPLLLNDFNHAKSNIKFVEAAAVKVPVLTTSASEFSTFITDNENGFIEDDFENWANRLLDFRRKPELLALAGEKAYSSIKDTLTTHQIEGDLLKRIKQIIADNIDNRYPNKSHQKYPNWPIQDNLYVPTVGKNELISRLNSYLQAKSKRGKAKYVVYTCLSNQYDSLKIPEFLDPDVDYVCFSDYPVFGYGIWEVRSYSQSISDPTRLSRHPKILPHLYLEEYEASIYIDANIMPVESLLMHFKRLSQSGAHLAGIVHPWRNCIYKEAEACKRGGKDAPETIDKTLKLLRSKGFPEDYGLFENNFIYRKHNEIDVIEAMNTWWQVYSKYSKRDQLSYMFALQQNGIAPETIFLTHASNVRNTAEFLYFSHGEDDLWNSPVTN